MKLNGLEVEFGRYPNLELNLPLDKLNVRPENSIRWAFKTNEDIVKLAILNSHLHAMNAVSELYITYLPYSRMDRPNGHYSVSLNCMAELLNNMAFTGVTIREPHSDASLSLIKNSSPEWWCLERIDKVITICAADSLFYPDKGACDRYPVGDKYKYATGKKRRDFESGNIEELKIKGTVGSRVLIIDDLCSRGGTFIKAAKLLKEKGAKNIYLLVAHCENNIFTGDIFSYIDMVQHLQRDVEQRSPQNNKIKIRTRKT